MFTRCPIAWLREDAAQEVQLVNEAALFRERSILPRAGGWRDQDPKFVEVLPVVEDELAKLRKYADETAEAAQRQAVARAG